MILVCAAAACKFQQHSVSSVQCVDKDENMKMQFTLLLFFIYIYVCTRYCELRMYGVLQSSASKLVAFDLIPQYSCSYYTSSHITRTNGEKRNEKNM